MRQTLPNGRVLRLWSRGDDWIANEVYWRGALGYEPETARVFFDLASRAQTIVDVGAFVGYYAILAALANPTARVFAFEPHPLVFGRLRRNIAANEASTVEAVPLALGERSGTAEFHHPNVDIPSSSSLSLGFMSSWMDGRDMRHTSVTVTTVDEFVETRDIERVDLVKLDTESTEPAILRGMRRTLDRDRPLIICEVLKGFGVEGQLEALLGPLGYRYYLLTPAGPQLQSAIEAHPKDLNYLFSPAPLPAR